MSEIRNIVSGLNIAAQEIYNNNKEKGFWDEGKDKNKLEALMLVVTELSEAVEAVRKNHYIAFEADYNSLLDGDFKKHFETGAKNTFEDEIADAVIRLLDLCGGYGINIERRVSEKIEYNKLRPYKHNKLL